ncbi:MAG: beta-ketoacyl-ACP reductase [Candidatus Sericytochromatia bacterium]|nr:beta-ketoacyl-ACP reductase [Candidatus Sericytochromatia bacterium]
MRFQDTVGIVTGAGRGIGRATALAMAEEGGRLALCDCDADRLADTVGVITAAGGTVRGWPVDVTRREQFTAMVQEVLAAWGRIDVLINNAGITRDATLARLTEPQWDRVMAVNLKAVMTCAQAVLPALSAQRSGRIINLTSLAGIHGNIGQTNYAAAKAGVIAMTQTWARELGPLGITVNAVAPGSIATDMVAAEPPETVTGWLGRIPLGRLGTVEDVARACLFLASADAAYITGHVLHVDGGQTL